MRFCLGQRERLQGVCPGENWFSRGWLPLVFLLGWSGLLQWAGVQVEAGQVTMLNVSYDPTREFYAAFDKEFAAHWKAKTGDDLVIRRSHGGSARQTRSVLEGLEADVVTLALAFDIEVLASRGKLIDAGWRERLPERSSPYTSVMVFLVRPGNPLKIRDWGDLVRPGVRMVAANPKSSGGARWVYLTAWAHAQRLSGSTEASCAEFVRRFYRNAIVLETGARAATTTFLNREMGDVLVTWENEARMALKESGESKAQIVVPPFSLLAEPPVAWVDRVVKRRGTAEVARAYLEYLYTEKAQELVAENFFRPTNAGVFARHRHRFPEVTTVRMEEIFGSWEKAHHDHFSETGWFDRIARDRQ